jgi:hypothetical protein
LSNDTEDIEMYAEGEKEAGHSASSPTRRKGKRKLTPKALALLLMAAYMRTESERLLDQLQPRQTIADSHGKA